MTTATKTPLAAASIVVYDWYREWSRNEDYPFIIPDPARRALVNAVTEYGDQLVAAETARLRAIIADLRAADEVTTNGHEGQQ